MRLLHTTDIRLQNFEGTLPEYAILSHTWGTEEVTLEDVIAKDSTKQGWKKIHGCCQRAAQDGWTWIWIDTCCIDKTSSAELSEAVNSMFSWYKCAAICYAYLEDVQVHPQGFQTRLRFSRWFKRGWTLQELLAPPFVLFLDKNWADIGTKDSLSNEIYHATTISLQDMLNFRSCCVARKMSWASNRKTTRVEDEAYCLLGLFGINMPLIYGEGRKAFLRLQEEIMKTSEDSTIFAWQSTVDLPASLRISRGFDNAIRQPEEGIIAPSTLNFANASQIRLSLDTKVQYSISKGRVELHTTARSFKLADGTKLLWACLNCTIASEALSHDSVNDSSYGIIFEAQAGSDVLTRCVRPGLRGLMKVDQRPAQEDWQPPSLKVVSVQSRTTATLRRRIMFGLTFLHSKKLVLLSAHPYHRHSSGQIESVGSLLHLEEASSSREHGSFSLSALTSELTVVHMALLCCPEQPKIWIVIRWHRTARVACYKWIDNADLLQKIRGVYEDPALLVDAQHKRFEHRCGLVQVALVPKPSSGQWNSYQVSVEFQNDLRHPQPES